MEASGSSVVRVQNALRRRLAWWRDPDRMVHPSGTRLYSSLLVADVDLDDDSCVLLAPITPPATPPEGVHAVVWMHGEPLGELTVPGVPEELVEALPQLARTRLREQREAHLRRDALRADPARRRAALRELREEEVSCRPTSSDRVASRTTVAVCTRDRPADLARCLQAISLLDPRPAEVLVVDNASATTATADVVGQYPFVRYVHEPRAGLDWARNRALLEAATPVVAFTDDDVLVHPGWVGGIERAFAEEPSAAAVTGLVIPAELSTPSQVAFEAEGGFGRGYQRKWFAVAVADGEVAAEHTAGTGTIGTGANAAFLREALVELGGFDTALDVGTPTGGGGDLEAFFRLLAAGRQVVYEPSATVRHRHRATTEGLRRQRLGDGSGSYSIYYGAGPAYGRRQRREFAAFGLWWAWQGLARSLAESLVAPRLHSPTNTAATARGALTAVLSRSYERARAQAAEQDRTHPGLPTAPLLVRPPAPERQERRRDPVVAVDVVRDDLDRAEPWPRDETPRRGVRLQVSSDGVPQALLTIRTGGCQLSSARLRWELAERLGPALGAPGAAREGRAAPRADHPCDAARVTSACVLMASRGRPEQLRRSVAALLAHQTEASLRVVVVDNSPEPGGATAALAGLDGVAVVHEARPGLSRARNAGMPLTSGDVVVFVDDDVVVQPGWLDSLLAPFSEPAVVAVTGNVLPLNADVLEAQMFEDYGGLGKGPHRRRFDRDWLTRSRRAAPTWQIGATANAAVRRDALVALGPWAENLGAGRPSGVGEDTELFYRILHAGGEIVYAADAVVLHEHRSDRAALLRQLADYSSGHVGYNLEVLVRYRDARGLLRIFLELPDYYVRHTYNVLRHRDYYPADMLRAELRGMARGVPDWLASRRRR